MLWTNSVSDDKQTFCVFIYLSDKFIWHHEVKCDNDFLPVKKIKNEIGLGTRNNILFPLHPAGHYFRFHHCYGITKLKNNLKANFAVFITLCATMWLELSDGMRNKSAHHIAASIFTRTLLECFLPPACAFCLISSLSTLCSRFVAVFSRAFISLLSPCVSVCSNQWHFTLTS